MDIGKMVLPRSGGSGTVLARWKSAPLASLAPRGAQKNREISTNKLLETAEILHKQSLAGLGVVATGGR